MRGFHLLEVLIVCAIVAILLSFAVPHYTTYVSQTKRTEAKVMLLKYAAALEQYHFLKHTYQGATFLALQLPEETSDHQYRIHIASASESAYVLQAIPQGAQLQRDVACLLLTLNEQGVRGVTGAASADVCWR